MVNVVPRFLTLPDLAFGASCTSCAEAQRDGFARCDEHAEHRVRFTVELPSGGAVSWVAVRNAAPYVPKAA